jgi:hypothetical protein
MASISAKLVMFVLAQYWSHAVQVVYLPQKLLRLLHQAPRTRAEVLCINHGFRGRLQPSPVVGDFNNGFVHVYGSH